MKTFGKQHDVEVQVTPYSNYDEMLAKIRAPGESFDLVFPGPSVLSKMVYTELIQPLNHSYVPNLENVWPEYQDPWYDLGAQYTVPYTIYGTGVLYRADRVSSVPDERLRPDLGRAVLGQGLPARRHAGSDRHVDAAQRHHARTSTPSDPELVREATDSLIELIDLVKIKVQRQRLLRGPRGHRDGPPGLVRRHDRRSVLPAQGRDPRRPGATGGRRHPRSASSAATTSRFPRVRPSPCSHT